jgi:hypothetical protein
MFLNLFKINIYLKKNIFQSNEYGRMNVDQNKFGDPIIITALVHGKPVGATELAGYRGPTRNIQYYLSNLGNDDFRSKVAGGSYHLALMAYTHGNRCDRTQ